MKDSLVEKLNRAVSQITSDKEDHFPIPMSSGGYATFVDIEVLRSYLEAPCTHETWWYDESSCDCLMQNKPRHHTRCASCGAFLSRNQDPSKRAN